MAYVVERFGRFNEILEPGLHFRVPVMDRVAYVHSLKETAVPIPNQSAITGDNVTLSIDGVVYVKIVDPEKVKNIYIHLYISYIYIYILFIFTC